ncbi:efflux RND transporter periplasmic adaptor subunit [Colwellia sp. E2M01]|uniref:efflux RND transporter periplasmic adaptor subunit n=1 Tax=Colwellia sp. E2M01 TaxID=2841561 RepID=UPI001C09E56F|nr:efflux RND transporter periplasmic adaptor subunit [Colwellia sp. E2M01]MBU2870378.1 efflux RND transporter periplasmic adaptor subunit [Colwellia sp. E2M01]
MSTSFNAKKLLVPVAIIAITVVLMLVIFKNPPESQRGKPSKAAQMTVETMKLNPKPYPIVVESFGTVEPRTQSVLYPQVSGQIIKVSKQFRAGGFFEKGDVLVQLDDRDLRAEVNIAKASLMSANQALQEEDARVKQAKTDWQRLGKGEAPSSLVLREPQYEAAKAQVLSAQALLDKAELALERTKIIAPYAGRILQKYVDIGQVISSSTQLADIFSVDYLEVRLPIKNKDLPLMVLPEEYRNTQEDSVKEYDSMPSNVVLTSNLMGNQAWEGHIVRTESAIDELSQQLYVVAQIIRPFDKKQNTNTGAQIKIGQYVTAKIKGRTVENTLVIPSSAIYQGSYVYIVENNLLMRKDIKLGWQNGTESIVTEGLKAGDELVLTSLGQVSSGTRVAIEGQAPSQENAQQDKPGPGKDPKKRRERLEQMAAEKGITVEELMAERKANKVKN